MKIIFFNTQNFEELAFKKNLMQFQNIQIDFSLERLGPKTAILSKGYDAVICFVNDKLDSECLRLLKSYNIKAIFLRSAGYNHVDVVAAKKLELPVYRVPAYSPEAIAEHAVGLLLCLNRKIHKAYLRIREMNFSLEGLVGSTLKNKKIGVVGVGKIGKAFATIMAGFGCEIYLYDVLPDEQFAKKIQGRYVSKSELLVECDIISIHCPLNAETLHLINLENIFTLKKGVVLVNTSRGPVIETTALIAGLKKLHIGGAALDVYEFESELFFQDHSAEVIQDELIARLMSFPNVLITAHQGFLTAEALDEISQVTLENIADFQKSVPAPNSANRIS